MSLKKKTLKKAISMVTALSTIVWLSGVSMFAVSVNLASAEITDGALISSNATNSDGTPTLASMDVYIVKTVGAKKFKRLILNPQVFASYQHFNWNSIQEVAQSVVDEYTTSNLIRVDGDPAEKIFGLAPDGDTGAKSWVNLTNTQFVTEGGADPDSVYVINSTDAGNYTAVGDVATVAQLTTFLTSGTLPSTTPVPSGALAVGLSASTSAAAVVPSGSNGVVFTKINFTAPADGDATITEVKVKRSGVGATTDLSAVFIYDGSTRLTNARTIASDTNLAEFTGMSVKVTAGTTKTLSIVANVATGDKTGTHALGINAASDITVTGATVSGSFPVVGNSMTLSSSDVGGLTVAANGTLTNPTIGDVGATIAKFQLTATTEDSMFKSITLKQDGTLSTTLLSNFTLSQGTADVPVTVTVNGRYVTLDLNTPMKLVNGAGKIFTLKGDVSSSSEVGKTIVFYVYNAADVLATSVNYGFGVVPNIDLYNAANDNGLTTTTTTRGGGLTIANLTSAASDVKTNSTAVELMRVKLTATADTMEVQKMSLALETTKSTVSAIDYGTYKDADSDADYGTGDTILISNIKIKDVDTGATVGASKAITDAVAVTAGGVTGAAWVATNDVDVDLVFQYTDYFTIAKGASRTLAVVADINSNQASDVVYKASLDFTGSTPAVSGDNFVVKDSQDNFVTDIVPRATVAGANRTTKTSSLTVSRASSPESVTVVKGAEVDALGMIFAAGSGTGNDVKVSSLTLNTYVDADVDGTYVAAVEGTVDANEVVTEVNLYVGGTKIAGPVSIDSSGNAVFSSNKFVGGYYTITAGTSKTILVKAKTSGTAPYGGTDDAFSFSLETADISAEDDNGTVNATVTGTSVNGTTSPTVGIRITSAGTITSAIDSSRPDAQLILAGLSTEQVVSKIKFTTTKEDYVIDKLTIEASSSASYDDVDYVQIYNAAGTALSASTQGLDSNGKATFTGLSISVPKVGGTVVTVKAKLTSIGERTTATDATAGVGADTGDAIAFNVSTTASDFHAVGSSSGSVDTAADAAVAQTMAVRKTKPTVALVTNNDPLGNTTVVLMKFSVTADANGDVALKGVQPTSTLTGVTITAGSMYLYDVTGTATQLNTTGVNGDAFIEIDDARVVTISAGTTRTFEIRADVTGFVASTGDSISTKITQDSAALSGTTETAANAVADAANNFVWSDRSADTNGVASTEWINSYQLQSWPGSQSVD